MTARDQKNTEIRVGDAVIKDSGDYAFIGTVVAVFAKRTGSLRIVVEDDRGLLMIYAGKNVRRA